MVKKATPLTADEVRDLISLDIATSSSEIAESVFDKKFESIKKELNGNVSKLVYGGIIAGFFLLISIAVSVFIFMASYHGNFLDTQAMFSQTMTNIQIENNSLHSDVEISVEKIKEKQEYIERLILENSI